MKKTRFAVLIASAAALFAAIQISCSSSSSTTDTATTGGHSTTSAHWTYSGEAGPDNWAHLDPQWELCGSGTSQSPIDITGGVSHVSSDMQFHYKATGGTVKNNGHTIVFTPTDGGYISVAGKQYNLLQFHFHAPSEHTVSGATHPMEGHLVSQASDGSYAVVGVFYDSGDANSVIDTVFAATSATENHDTTISGSVDPTGLLPSAHTYYRYSGSLTTPPCSEGLVWSVLDNATTASASSIQQMVDLYNGNARPVQPLNGREISHGM